MRPRHSASSVAQAVAGTVALEALEIRQHMSVTAKVDNGRLVVHGDDQANVISVSHAGATTLVNGMKFADAAITDGIGVYPGYAGKPGGVDTVNVFGTAKRVDVYNDFGGPLHVGSAVELVVGNNGRTNGVRGVVHFHSAFGQSTLTVDDSADTRASHVYMTRDAVTDTVRVRGIGGATVEYDNTSYFAALDVHTGKADDTFDVSDIGSGFNTLKSYNVIDTGGGSNTVNVLGMSGKGTLLINNAGGGTDHIRVGDGRLAGITGTIAIYNPQGRDSTLYVDDSNETASRDVLNSSPFAGEGQLDYGVHNAKPVLTVQYNNDALDVLKYQGGSGGNHYAIRNTFENSRWDAYSLTEFDTGYGNDTTVVTGTTGGLHVYGQGGHDKVTVTGQSSRTLARVKGSVDVKNDTGFTALSVDDTDDTYARKVVFDNIVYGTDSRAVEGLGAAKIYYRPLDVNALTVSTGSGADQFVVGIVDSSTPVTLNGNGGNDRFFVGNADNALDDIQAALTFNGGSGTNTAVLHDEGTTTLPFYIELPDRVLRTGTAPVYFQNVGKPALYRKIWK